MPNEPKICPIMSNRNLGNDVTSLWVACQQSKCQLWVESADINLAGMDLDMLKQEGHCGLISRG
jgi:hypothetical protein